MPQSKAAFPGTLGAGALERQPPGVCASLAPPPARTPTHPPAQEGDARKASAGHVEVETYLQHLGMPFTVFQPLYIYGPHTAKDCEQWFMDRILR